MSRFRVLVLAVLMPVGALAQVNECAEAAAGCREDCSIEHSSLRPDAPRKLNKCLKKCQKKFTTCEERELETNNNSLEAGSLDKSPVSGDVDENNMPTRTAVKKAKSTDEEEEKRPPRSDDVRDDQPATAPEPAKAARKSNSEEAEARAPRDEVRESELPKSSRTALKVDEKEAKTAPPPAAKPGQPEPIVMTPKAVTRKEEDLRDDRPKVEPPPVKKSDKPRKDDPPAAPAKPREEDHDDLRNY